MHIIKIPDLDTDQKSDSLMQTDNNKRHVPNVKRDLNPTTDGSQYIYQTGNLAKIEASKYRHRFGIAFDQRDYVSSNIFSTGVNWVSCEEISGNSV